jgi:hypothetical protein
MTTRKSHQDQDKEVINQDKEIINQGKKYNIRNLSR